MRPIATQLNLPIPTGGSIPHPLRRNSARLNSVANKLDRQDRMFHDWYRFVLSFPPHLVREYIEDFKLGGRALLLDPFCGTGTTLIEAKLLGIPSVGIEANPFAHFASSVKIDWRVSPVSLADGAERVAQTTLRTLRSQGIDDEQPSGAISRETRLCSLEADSSKLLLTDSISPLPLHKTLVLLSCLHEHREEPFYGHALLAFANALVFQISNLHFGPEVGVQGTKADVPVVSSWLEEIKRMVDDLAHTERKRFPPTKALLGDARCVSQILKSKSIDAVITSPPYPNEKDYTRTTRLESVMLGFVTNRGELRSLKKNLIRSNTRGVYKDDDDDKWVARHPKIQRIANSIEKRRKELGKNSGFEKLYGRVTRLYFGGMARHLADLRYVLKPGANLAYVVGDQASYLRIMIRTGALLAEVAESLGYQFVRTDLFRTRFATATKEQLREEVVVLRWKG